MEFIICVLALVSCSFVLGFSIGNDNMNNPVRLLAILFITTALVIISADKHKDKNVIEYYVSKEIGYTYKPKIITMDAVQNRIKRVSIEIEKDAIEDKYMGMKWKLFFILQLPLFWIF